MTNLLKIELIKPVIITEYGKANAPIPAGSTVEVYDHTAKELVNIGFARPVGWKPESTAANKA